jgi:hypothetical protein
MVIIVAYALLFAPSEEEAGYHSLRKACDLITIGKIIDPEYCNEVAKEAVDVISQN